MSYPSPLRQPSSKETVYLEITDRGISQEIVEGFKSSGNGVGVGLAGIRERIREVDGKLDLSIPTSRGFYGELGIEVPELQLRFRSFSR